MYNVQRSRKNLEMIKPFIAYVFNGEQTNLNKPQNGLTLKNETIICFFLCNVRITELTHMPNSRKGDI